MPFMGMVHTDWWVRSPSQQLVRQVALPALRRHRTPLCPPVPGVPGRPEALGGAVPGRGSPGLAVLGGVRADCNTHTAAGVLHDRLACKRT